MWFLNRGVAQLIGRRIWDAEVASLSLATPTRNLSVRRVFFRTAGSSFYTID